MNLKGKVALITGTIGNIGPIWVEALKEKGCKVVELNNDIDVSSRYKVNCFFEEMFYNKSLGLDIVVNNAAIDNPPVDQGGFFDKALEIINVNLFGAVNISRKAVPLMKKTGGGVIINIGSILGNVAADWRNYDAYFEKPVAYNVSKAGLIQLTRSLAVQYARDNIRSVCISFAAVDTGKFTDPFSSKFKSCLPLGKFISRESLKKTLLYACECDELTGTQILVDSGYTSW